MIKLFYKESLSLVFYVPDQKSINYPWGIQKLEEEKTMLKKS